MNVNQLCGTLLSERFIIHYDKEMSHIYYVEDGLFQTFCHDTTASGPTNRISAKNSV